MTNTKYLHCFTNILKDIMCCKCLFSMCKCYNPKYKFFGDTVIKNYNEIHPKSWKSQYFLISYFIYWQCFPKMSKTSFLTLFILPKWHFELLRQNSWIGWGKSDLSVVSVCVHFWDLLDTLTKNGHGAWQWISKQGSRLETGTGLSKGIRIIQKKFMD